MVGRSQRALELLLPDAQPELWRRARRVTTFLRLLSDDAQPDHARTVPVTLESARAELDRQGERRLRQALVDLLRVHLRACVPPDGFAWFAPPARDAQSAWSALETLRAEAGGLPHVPEPGEPSARVARRLVEAAQRLLPGRGEWLLWQARCLRVERGPEAGEQALRELLAVRAGEAADPARDRRAVAGVAECLLDRGAVRRAGAWLQEAAVPHSDERLRWLSFWIELLSGQPPKTRAGTARPAPWGGRIPRSLVELRERVPAWLPWLPGRAPLATLPGETPEEPPRSRADLGASLLAVFSFSAGEARVVFSDVAPGLRRRFRAWLTDRDGAVGRPGEPEHDLVVTARTRVVHRLDDAVLRGALGGAATRALALVPIRSHPERVAGWLHLECEHHLLPSLQRLEMLAASWRDEVALIQARAHAAGSPAEPADRADEDVDGCGSADPRGAVFEALIADLALKTRERHWWGFSVEDAGTVLVANGGDGLVPLPSVEGGRRALERARAAGGRVVIDDPSAELSIHPDAASGVVLPLRAHGELCGLLAIESSRRRDLRGPDLERIADLAAHHAPALRLAQFRVWHEERFGWDVHFDVSSRAASPPPADVVAAGRCSAPVLVLGPPGCGKRVVARRLHFESARHAGPLEAHACGAQDRRWEAQELFGLQGESSGLLERAGAGTLLLQHLHRLAPALQSRLAAWIAAGQDGARDAQRDPRVVATTLPPAHAGGEGAGLVPALERRLARFRLEVPPLCERREEIPALVELFRRRFAREERHRAPSLEEDALALVWRQPWSGNHRELEDLVYKLVLLHPGERIGARQVAAVAARFGIELVQRIPSRQPDRRDLEAALETTRNRRGSINKSRAARLLGWDPDTLTLRLREAGLGSTGPGAAPPA